MTTLAAAPRSLDARGLPWNMMFRLRCELLETTPPSSSTADNAGLGKMMGRSRTTLLGERRYGSGRATGAPSVRGGRPRSRAVAVCQRRAARSIRPARLSIRSGSSVKVGAECQQHAKKQPRGRSAAHNAAT